MRLAAKICPNPLTGSSQRFPDTLAGFRGRPRERKWLRKEEAKGGGKTPPSTGFPLLERPLMLPTHRFATASMYIHQLVWCTSASGGGRDI